MVAGLNVLRRVMGQPVIQHRSDFEKKGWTPVHQSDFDHVLDGRFMPKGIDEVIIVDDAILMARPIDIQRRALARLKADANAPLQIKQAELGTGLPVSGGDHPSATRQNRINRSMERIEVKIPD